MFEGIPTQHRQPGRIPVRLVLASLVGLGWLLARGAVGGDPASEIGGAVDGGLVFAAMIPLAPPAARAPGAVRAGTWAMAGMTLALVASIVSGLGSSFAWWGDIVLSLIAVVALSYVLLLLRQVRHQDRIVREADFDSMTGLLNREGFDRALEPLLEVASEDALVAVLFVDLDRFKVVNDTHGHDVGDELLIEVGKILEQHVRQNDLVGRVGGDEFVLALTGLREDRSASTVAEKLLGLLNAPIEVGGRTLSIGASIGIAIYPTNGDTGDDLLKSADEAMYRIKNSGKNHFAFSTQDISVEQTRIQEIDRRLRFALEDGHLDLRYQPIFDLESKDVHGFEVLMRWHSPDLGAVSPGEFIALAERNGLIVPIGTWALREACHQAGSWLRQGYEFETISVNVSTLQFEQPNFIDTVSKAVADAGLPPEKLELEVTESLFARDVGTVSGVLRKLKRLGVRTALDDFGTGYSALSYLMHMPFDTIKIDASFVHSLSRAAGAGNPAGSVVKAVCALAADLGKSVTAEGVESVMQRDQLLRAGAHRAQGFLFSKPLTNADATELLKRETFVPKMVPEDEAVFLLHG